ncbi:MAG: peptidylprolyl isomerase [Rhodospirillales bacterium]|nr:peptidylprolyl isomerase [Rhodospirillales bacterium]
MALGVIPALAQTPKPLDNQADPVVATVDGVPILRSELIQAQRALPAQLQQMPPEILLPAVVERLINTKLIVLAGRKDKLAADAEVKKRVTAAEDQVIQDVYLNRLLEARINDQTIRQRYDQMIKDKAGKEEISARHILVQTEPEAREIIAALKKGGDFAALAKEKSVDPAGKQQGGDLGYFGREDMVPEFSEAAFKLKDGEISQDPVRTQFGWHVIKVEAHRTKTQSFEEMREELASEMTREIVGDTVTKLREAAKVERFNIDGSPRTDGGGPPAR